MKTKHELEYELFCTNSPITENPSLDKHAHHIEQRIQHVCGKSFRVFVNTPISDTSLVGIICPHCNTPANNFVMISRHSAGVFNSCIIKRLPI
jgi:hypothetical protein